MKLPATVSPASPEHRGSIILNPGGPGASGVGLLNRGGKIIQHIVQGTYPTGNDTRYYDIVSFDPRGVGHTTPPISCSGTKAQMESWRLRNMEEGTVTSSDAAMGRLWAMMLATSGKCAHADEFSIQRYATTVSVARDMLELVDALARWSRKSDARPASHLGKLQYWGFSYGSVLGTTFAAMYPDRVGRIIVDGVVDVDNYVGTSWSNNLVDAESDMNLFYHHCARVGHPTCAIADTNNATAKKVKVRTAAIYKQILHRPVPVSQPYAEVVSWSDLKNINFVSLYRPYEGFPNLARILADLEAGNGTAAARQLRYSHLSSCPLSSGRDTPRIPLSNATYQPADADPFVSPAILCTDRIPESHLTVSDFAASVANLTALSPTAGDLWAAIRLPCLGYPLRAHHRFTGPWTGKTSHPLLFIGNTADPVTPLSAAVKMSAGFEGARVLVQDSPGHSSASVFSPCTARYVHEYFFHGTLPAPDTVCNVPVKPFGDTVAEAAAASGGDLETSRAASEAVAGHAALGRALLEAGGGMGVRSDLWG